MSATAPSNDPAPNTPPAQPDSRKTREIILARLNHLLYTANPDPKQLRAFGQLYKDLSIADAAIMKAQAAQTRAEATAKSKSPDDDMPDLDMKKPEDREIFRQAVRDIYGLNLPESNPLS